MKKIFFYALIVLNFSCKSFDDFRNQKVLLISNKSEKIESKNGAYYLNLKINGVSGNFLFDTGAMTSVIDDDAFLKGLNLNEKNYYTSFKLKSADGVQIESRAFVSDSISSTIIKGDKNIFKHINNIKAKINCDKDNFISSGIIGFDIFKRAAQPILFDIKNNLITVLETKYSTAGYQKIGGKIATGLGDEITIPLKVENKLINFTLDSGFNGGILISPKSINIDKSKLVATFEAGYFVLNKLINKKTEVYNNVSIEKSYLFDEPAIISSTTNINHNLLGTSFIKQFNWIFDFNTGDVYVKRIAKDDSDLIDKINKYQLKCLAINNDLIIGFKKSPSFLQYNIGDQIISVNGSPVTTENICEMQDLLNKTQDWNTLKLEVITPKK